MCVRLCVCGKKLIGQAASIALQLCLCDHVSVTVCVPCRLFCLRTWSLHKRYALITFLHVLMMCMHVCKTLCLCQKADWPSCFHGLAAVCLCDCVCATYVGCSASTLGVSIKKSIYVVYFHSCKRKCWMYLHVCKTPVSKADFKADSML